MLKLTLSPRALIDLEDIYEYTLLTWGYNQAEKYQDELFEAMLRVSDNPKTGSLYY